jgi:CMP-2-keto-3-deoxyoctulosonic acid synthetase
VCTILTKFVEQLSKSIMLVINLQAKQPVAKVNGIDQYYKRNQNNNTTELIFHFTKRQAIKSFN